ncbi:MAG: VIT1/CCC1 transporter family protein [archaeon]|nr:VIT1/CCC1 transporter family protein [archaeon]
MVTISHLAKHFSSRGKYLKSWIYGGLDGVITTFAVVAGVMGANLSSAVILILGFANLIADGISMAVGDYISTKSEEEYYQSEEATEEMEVKSNPKNERKDFESILIKKGFKKEDAKKISLLISRNKNYEVETMLHEELGLNSDHLNPKKNAFVTFISFFAFGLIPLLLFVIGAIFNLGIPNAFLFASILSGVSMFVLGVVKSKVTKKSSLKSGFETLLIGGIAAIAAYFVGEILSKII